MNTEEAIPTNTDTLQGGSFHHAVAIYAELPDKANPHESGNAAFLLRYLLKREFAAQFVEFKEPKEFVSFDNLVFGLFIVEERGPALDAISRELRNIGIIDKSQIAWRNVAEDFWQDYWPSCPAIPFQKRCEEVDGWAMHQALFTRLMTPHLIAVAADMLRILKPKEGPQTSL